MAARIKIKTIVQNDLLVLPSPKKKTATVAGRLLTEDLLLQIAEDSDEPKKPNNRKSCANESRKAPQK
ncbi:Hypothetical protein PHPALM_16911 [Phytophthora palmivora]|uniref:Uncharacterized protein n=1 Tax=Phytophthora palmivora TaxID=4796 RepID=A0A2P4XNK1_9STRA|nr:Hypothetical protein PHPALM_16911 [Phytophthora palmivora]